MANETHSLTQEQLNSWWMPFTPNRVFKTNPKLYVAAEGMHMTMADGRKIIDATAGLWCVNAGHGRKEIADAVHQQLMDMDYANPFGFGHPKAFELAHRLATEIAPEGLNRVFFTNSGSEAVDTALKMARAYWRARGQGEKTKFIARHKAYHGVNFGGVSVAGLTPNRKNFGPVIEADFLNHTLLPENAFSKGQPEHGAELADELERIVALHDASNIAAVIVEPMSGAGGVILPPKGYLEKLRAICDKHDILLIFDEVITCYGRLGASCASVATGITPDIITSAKGLTNGVIPMGAVMAKQEVYDACMQGPENIPEFMHGYTYSGHPVACAAALATLDIYKNEKLFERAGTTAEIWQEGIHRLDGLPYVTDVRNWGLVGAIDLEPHGEPGPTRGQQVAAKLLEKGITVRAAGDTLMMSPPLIIESSHIDQIFDAFEAVLKS
ncbi:aspartate aminotransferase family protein [Biformimicrobium ophioploci]|uniref:Aspartate aminotransferase family protein n=1 Tax=Biformimicrobium ophioploci TaxID=3036711 RepID=A0ABQ6LY03_9GAMM|nr:aspartate aminotransferase family protein [Microbulbifer sp. NKW57]GMG86988.1 aspartate aminotransferase family protein [Microbulbifer sp. NKW57]